LDFRASTASARSSYVQLGIGPVELRELPGAIDEIDVSESGGAVRINTGAAIFEIQPGAFLISRVCIRNKPDHLSIGDLRVRTEDGATCPFTVHTWTVEERGPLRTTVRLDGAVRTVSGKRLLVVVARLHCFAGLATVQMDVTLRNPNR